MKIRFIKPPAPLGLAYFQGNEAEFEEKQATELVEMGYAVVVEKAEPKAETKTEPKAKKGK